MNQTNTPTNLQPTTDTALQTIQSAITGFKNAHPTASEQEIADFSEKVIVRVRSSYRNLIKTDYRADRRKRQEEAKKLIKDLDLTMAYGRLISEAGLSATGGIAVALKKEEGKITLAAAICSLDDNFDYLRGRELAAGRYNEGLTLTFETEQLDPDLVRRQYLALLEKAQRQYE